MLPWICTWMRGSRFSRNSAAKSDIIEFNLRPGVTNRWNVGYEQIKEISPGIIYIEKNGFGQWGRYGKKIAPANDGAAQALAGYAWISSFPGRPPLKQSIWICDVFGALMGEVAVLSALHHRKKTGRGQYIEMSQSENIMRAMGWVWPYQQFTEKGAEPSGEQGPMHLSGRYVPVPGRKIRRLGRSRAR